MSKLTRTVIRAPMAQGSLFSQRQLRAARNVLAAGAAVACVGALSACTFVTSCPTGQSGTPQSNGGTGNGSGGSGNPGGGAPGGVIVDGGAPGGDWNIATPSFFSGIQTMCGPMSYLYSKPSEDMIIAGLNVSPVLWASEDGGANWQQLGSSKSSDPMDHGVSSVVFDPQDPQVFWESGSYGSFGGVYKSTDNGVTLKQLGNITHDDFVSVDFSDPDRKTLLASGHEVQILHKSTDGGQTWTDIGGSVTPGIKVCSYPLILDTQTYLLGCGGKYDAGKPAILRSTDAGASWTQVYDNGGASAPLVASDGSIYWAAEFGGGLARSTDQGQTWTQVVKGTVLSLEPAELPDGRIAAVTSDSVIVSADHGTTWKKVSAPLPYTPNGFIYSGFQKAFFIWFFSCGDPHMQAPPNAIMRFDFDYQTF